jgi:hypothetical protein
MRKINEIKELIKIKIIVKNKCKFFENTNILTKTNGKIDYKKREKMPNKNGVKKRKPQIKQTFKESYKHHK